MLLMLMLIVTAFPLSGCFITAGARSLVKLMVSLSSGSIMVVLIPEQNWSHTLLLIWPRGYTCPDILYDEV